MRVLGRDSNGTPAGWASPRSILRSIALLLFGLLIAANWRLLAQETSIGVLSGTLKKIRDSGTITLGYRESSLPFSYLNRRSQPIGYSIDLCREVVEDVSTELDGMELKIAFVAVTSADRLQKVASGEVDLECGSTTNNVLRQKEVAFSPIFFVAGTKLMVPKSSSIRSYRDLADRTVVVTAGTTNETALRTLSDKQKLRIHIVTARDHAQSLQMLVSGGADAFATDDVLLYGFIATAASAHDMMVVGDYLSYDPYGLVYRRDDPQFTSIVERTFARMASERRLTELYNKWFLRRLPTGETLNLPMSPQLEEIFRVLGQSD
jgi:glutamate/aspartate transport system substrate-binding protein